MAGNNTFTLDRIARVTFGILVASVVVLFFYKISSVLLPFLIGWLIAYLLYPIVRFFQYKCRLKYRVLAILATMLSIALVGAVLILAVIPSMVSEFAKMGVLLVDYVQRVRDSGFAQSAFYQWFIGCLEGVDFNNMLTWQNLSNLFEKLVPQFSSLISGTWQLVAGVFVVAVILLYVIFILIDYEKISNGFLAIIPQKHRALVGEIVGDVENGMNKYFRGQATIALIVGVLFAIGFRIIGLPMAITMGLLIGVLNIVPYLQTVGFIPVIFLALLQSMETQQSFWLLLLYVALVLIVVQGFQDLFLVPRIIGKAMGLNPATILLSLSIWGALFGIVGMIIALPATTLIISYYKRYVIGGGEQAGERKENELGE